MRKSLIAVLSSIVLSVVVPSSTRAATLEEIKKRGYMVVATEDNYPPFEFVQDGQPAGLDHDLYKLLKEWAGGVQVRQEILPWQGSARRRRLRAVRRRAVGGDDQRSARPAALLHDADRRGDALLHEAQG